MTGDAHIVDTRSTWPRRRRLISLMGMMLTLRQYLKLLKTNIRLILERVNNRRTPYIAAPSAIVSFPIRQYAPSAGTRLTQVICVMYFNLPIPRNTSMEVYINEIMLPRSSAILRRKYRNR